MKKFYLFSIFLFIALSFNVKLSSQNFELKSPDGNINLQVDLKKKIYYTVYYKSDLVIYPSPLSLTINDGKVLGFNPVLRDSDTRYIDQNLEPVWGRRKIIKDEFNELNLSFENNYGIIFRAYDDGIAWRFYTKFKDEIIVQNEEASFYFTKDYPTLLAVAGDFQTSFEQIRQWTTISEMNEENFAHPPVVVDFESKLKLSITDADIRDYPGMYVYRPGSNNRFQLKGLFPAYPAKVEKGGWGGFSVKVLERENFIAKTKGNRSFPWRVIVMSEDDAKLAESDIVYKLASPVELDNTDWIKPGKVSWEWWNDWNLEGVDFKTGVNNETYKYYIDFASENGLEYVIMDEGWSDQFDITLPVPGLDVPMLMEYARERAVKLILWCVWHTLDEQMDEAFDLFQEWGAAGVKVDFIDRDDQVAMNFFERCAREAAKHELLVDYHGCPKPHGLSRAYPNVINYEGVVGNEYNKGNWGGNFPTPEHNVTIPFTRMMSGPMDYTPGAMRNSTQTSFGFSNSTPMSRGTRCHQLGMYVVYDSPLQMLCDAPTEYEKYPDILEFLSNVPVTWDDTRVLEGKIGDYIITLRQKDEDWYLGGLTDWNAREFEIDMSFLPEGEYEATLFM
ncbi:MAG: glycoside hydrolase family 97 protein, partial [Bacteroidales bacterium]